MSKKVIAFLLAFFLIETGTAYSLSFKLGGFFGGQNSFTDKYDAAPIGYVEQKIFEKGDLDIRVSLGLTYLDS
nr:hypothetical protein [bacterium]